MTDNAVSFQVFGPCPSKANFRRGGKDWRRRWGRIKDYERVVGWEAKSAGAAVRPGQVVDVAIALYRQQIDADNSAKILLDGMKGVAFEDDSAAHVGDVTTGHRPDDGKGKRVEVELTYREAS